MRCFTIYIAHLWNRIENNVAFSMKEQEIHAYFGREILLDTQIG
jgi:hypothetical protein